MKKHFDIIWFSLINLVLSSSFLMILLGMGLAWILNLAFKEPDFDVFACKIVILSVPILWILKINILKLIYKKYRYWSKIKKFLHNFLNDKRTKFKTFVCAFILDMLNFFTLCFIFYVFDKNTSTFSDYCFIGIIFWLLTCGGILPCYISFVRHKFKKFKKEKPKVKSIKLFNYKKYIVGVIMVSFSISLLQYIYSLVVSWYGTAVLWLQVFIPALIVLAVCLIGLKTYSKFPGTTRTIIAMINVFIIVIVQILYFGIGTLFFAALFEREVTQVKDYKHALHSIGLKERISHFPKNIPDEAQNVVLRKSSNNWFGSEEIYLIFDINEEYINNELSNYKFEHKEGPFADESKYDRRFRILDTNNLRKQGYKVYYIKLRQAPEGYYCNGIAVKENTIMYFYSYPD